MDNELLDVSADVDVDDLMARIRESVKNRKSSSPPRFAAPLSRRKLQPIEIENILQEVYRGGSLAEVINQIPLKRRGWKGRLELGAKKLLKWVVHWNTKAQADFNRSVMNSLGLIAQHLQTAQNNLVTTEGRLTEESRQRAELGLQVSEQMGQADARLEAIVVAIDAAALQQLALERRINEQSEQLRSEINQQITEQVAHLSAVLDETSNKADAVRMNHKINEQVAHLPAILDEIATRSGTSAPQVSSMLQNQPFDYFLFEHRYRGSISEIKQRQSAYLELFLDRQNVVDLGCGRGEFVELLSEEGVNVTGIDNSQDMIQFCQDRGLRVVQADMFAYLSSLPDACLDGIFASQVVEHLSPARILMLIGLCEEKLRPGGVIVAETVNTNCPVALSNFYLDPTHVRPVPPEMLKFMFEQRAFEIQTLKFSSPLPGSNVNAVLDIASGFTQEGSVYQDYAVVAVRPELSPSERYGIGEGEIEESLLLE
jgi:2-polyprenyl-3-methyl-5-hydroxy-6-metoxy-1,4-benzoquinol methylase